MASNVKFCAWLNPLIVNNAMNKMDEKKRSMKIYFK